MTGVLAFLWFFGSLAAAYFIVRPKPAWSLVANRKRATGLFFAVFIGAPILQALIGGTDGSASPTPATAEAMTPEQVAAEQKAAADAREASSLEEMRKNPENYLTFTDTSATKEGFDTVFSLSGKIQNTGKIAYKDPVIECEYFSETDTRLGRVKDTLYKSVPPGEVVRFAEFNMGFANSEWQKYSCVVRGATLNEAL